MGLENFNTQYRKIAFKFAAFNERCIFDTNECSSHTPIEFETIEHAGWWMRVNKRQRERYHIAQLSWFFRSNLFKFVNWLWIFLALQTQSQTHTYTYDSLFRMISLFYHFMIFFWYIFFKVFLNTIFFTYFCQVVCLKMCVPFPLCKIVNWLSLLMVYQRRDREKKPPCWRWCWCLCLLFRC